MLNKNQRFMIMSLVFLSLFVLGIIDNLRGALFPEILHHYGITSSEGAWFYIIASTFSILSGYFSRHACQKIDTLKIWRGGVGLMAIGGLMISKSSSFQFLLLGASVLGLGFGILAVTQNLLVTNVTNGPATKKALSGLHSMYGMAAVLAPLFVTMAAKLKWPWQNLFALTCLGALVLFLLSFNPRWAPPIRTKEKKAVGFKNKIRLLKESAFIIVAIASYVGLEMLLCTRLTSYLTLELGWPIEKASLNLIYFFISLFSGRLLFSFYHPPFSLRNTLVFSLLGAMFLLILGLQWHPLFLSLTGFLMAPFYPIGLALLAEMFPGRVSAVMSSTIVFQSLAIIIMNFFVGWVSDHWSITAAMYLSLGFGFSACLFLLIQKHPKAEEPLTTTDLPVATFEEGYPQDLALKFKAENLKLHGLRSVHSDLQSDHHP